MSNLLGRKFIWDLPQRRSVTVFIVFIVFIMIASLWWISTMSDVCCFFLEFRRTCDYTFLWPNWADLGTTVSDAVDSMTSGIILVREDLWKEYSGLFPLVLGSLYINSIYEEFSSRLGVSRIRHLIINCWCALPEKSMTLPIEIGRDFFHVRHDYDSLIIGHDN